MWNRIYVVEGKCGVPSYETLGKLDLKTPSEKAKFVVLEHIASLFQITFMHI